MMRTPFRCLAIIAIATCYATVVDAQQTREIIRGVDPKPIYDQMLSGGSISLLQGVPEKYHFLYLWNFDKKHDEIRDALPFSEIELSKTMCLGRCPAFRAKLSLAGEATYYGQQFAPRDGYHVGEIHPYSFARLCWAIERLKLTEDKRVPNTIVDDTSETILRITVKGTDKPIAISNYGSASTIELLLFSSLANDVIESIDWKPAPEAGGEQSDQRADWQGLID